MPTPSTFDEIFIETLGITGISIAAASTIPPSGTSIGSIIRLGQEVPALASEPVYDGAARLVSVFRATLDEAGRPQAQYVWLYNDINCHLHQRRSTMNTAIQSTGAAGSGGSGGSGASSQIEELSKMTTFKNKEKNAKRQLRNMRIYMGALLFALVLFTFGLYALTMGYTGMDKSTARTLNIGLSATVLLTVLLYSIFNAIRSMRIEEMFEADNCRVFTVDNVSTANTVLRDSMQSYLTDAKVLADSRNLLSETGDMRAATLATNVLNDNDNLNYLNMRRYELVNFKLRYSDFNIRYLLYGFVMVSILGLVRGSTVDDGPMAGLFKLVTIVLVLVYFTSYAMHFKNNQLRKRYNFEQLYWNSNNLSKIQDN